MLAPFYWWGDWGSLARSQLASGAVRIRTQVSLILQLALPHGDSWASSCSLSPSYQRPPTCSVCHWTQLGGDGSTASLGPHVALMPQAAWYPLRCVAWGKSLSLSRPEAPHLEKRSMEWTISQGRCTSKALCFKCHSKFRGSVELRPIRHSPQLDLFLNSFH